MVESTKSEKAREALMGLEANLRLAGFKLVMLGRAVEDARTSFEKLRGVLESLGGEAESGTRTLEVFALVAWDSVPVPWCAEVAEVCVGEREAVLRLLTGRQKSHVFPTEQWSLLAGVVEVEDGVISNYPESLPPVEVTGRVLDWVEDLLALEPGKVLIATHPEQQAWLLGLPWREAVLSTSDEAGEQALSLIEAPVEDDPGDELAPVGAGS